MMQRILLKSEVDDSYGGGGASHRASQTTVEQFFNSIQSSRQANYNDYPMNAGMDWRDLIRRDWPGEQRRRRDMSAQPAFNTHNSEQSSQASDELTTRARRPSDPSYAGERTSSQPPVEPEKAEFDEFSL